MLDLSYIPGVEKMCEWKEHFIKGYVISGVVTLSYKQPPCLV